MKNYLVQFYSSVNPTLIAGFSPTFTVFNVVPGGGATTPPGITQIPTNTGLYYFSYDPTSSIAFVIDGGASLPTSARYIAGILDPIQKVDEQLTAVGSTMQAIGQSLLAQGVSILAQGSTSGGVGALLGDITSSYGTTLTDPTTVFGYLKRLYEFNEGNNVFNKSSGVWDIYTRGVTYVLGPSTYPGASTMLRSKTIEDDGSIITRT